MLVWTSIDKLFVWTSIWLQEAEFLGGGNEYEKLWSQLRISVEDLGKVELGMFLDIACFFS
jgi:hypothetical protein